MLYRYLSTGIIGFSFVSIFLGFQTHSLNFNRFKSEQKQTNSSIIQNNNLFLKKKLMDIDILKQSNGHAEFIYKPNALAQGHNKICHGGFTACMIEFAARNMNEENSDNLIKDFYLRYTKPINVLKYYRIVLQKKEDNQIHFKIFPHSEENNDEVYAFGHLKFEN